MAGRAVATTLLPVLFMSGLAGVPLPARSGDGVVQFVDTSVSLLHGSGFKVEPKTQTTFTIEQVSGWSFGDLYWFVDSLHYSRDDGAGHRSSWYGEFSPRLSLGKLTGHPWRAGPVEDVLIAATYELGRDRRTTESGLLGVGFDLDAAGFDYLQVNVYARKDFHRGDWDTWQLTVTGARPFTVGRQRFMIDGFFDYVAPGGPHSWNLHVVPQLKWDLGHALGHADGKLWLGVEVDLWWNKFGIPDSRGFPTDQRTASLLLRQHF
ncbi:outer membrane protein OmpK [Luteimonas salinilitoris]|uniref:Outer membrane protein OmpK n=1 Tax=Luteimonas salinilitoris TaxID=3237697 RepID=A0ABV4HR50_9GAMM